MTIRNEEILKAAHELEYPENVPYFVNGAEWADKHPSKESLRPQSTWKPSDEQIEALESATENCAYSEYQDCLRELIGQLKKLKENNV